MLARSQPRRVRASQGPDETRPAVVASLHSMGSTQERHAVLRSSWIVLAGLRRPVLLVTALFTCALLPVACGGNDSTTGGPGPAGSNSGSGGDGSGASTGSGGVTSGSAGPGSGSGGGGS